MKFDNLLLIAFLGLAVLLALKSLKQVVVLSFTLLSLKIVWIVIIFLFLARAWKKSAQSAQKNKKP